MTSTMSEVARVMVAQGQLTQAQFDQLFGADSTRGGGEGTEPGGKPLIQSAATNTKRLAPPESESSPSPRGRIGKDAAAGYEPAEEVIPI